MEESEISTSNSTMILFVLIAIIITFIIVFCAMLLCFLNARKRNDPSSDENSLSRCCRIFSGLKPSFNWTDRRLSEQLNL